MDRINFSNWIVLERIGNKVVITPNDKVNTLFIVPLPVNNVNTDDIKPLLDINDFAGDYDLLNSFNLLD